MPKTPDPTLDRFRTHYRRLRVRWWLTCAGMAGGVLLIVVAPLLVSPPRARDAGFAGLLMCAAAWTLHLLAFFMLVNARCPRCQGRFAVSGLNCWPTNTCKHCGLSLD
jgi:hypothetical protein